MTSRGWSVSSAAQSRNDDRKPCGTAVTSRYWSMFGNVDVAIDLPLRIGNTSRLPSPNARAASRTSSARPHSGTRCSCFAFIRVAGTVYTAAAVSISSHVASRTSPDRAVSTRSSKASFVPTQAGAPFHAEI